MYKKLLIACFIAIFTQAIITNICALLCVPFMTEYGLTISGFGLLVGVNFMSQLAADILLTSIIDKLSYKKIVLWSCGISFFGFLIFVSAALFRGIALPLIFISTAIFSFASGMLEVTLSPIVDTIPDDYKSKKTAMSLLHSFYAWGQFVCIIGTTLMIYFFSVKMWYIPVLIFNICPLVCFILFLKVDIKAVRKKEKSVQKFKTVFSPFFILCMLAIMFGAGTEIVMNQFVSSFCELNLNLTKMQSDIIGMGGFALMLGIGRMLYGFFGNKFDLSLILIISSFAAAVTYLVVGLTSSGIVSVICAVLTGLFSSLLWPGTLSLAGERLQNAGAWIFSFLAIAGDVGGTIFPALSGQIADRTSFNTLFLIFAAVPFLTAIFHILIKRGSGGGESPLTR